MDNNIYLAACDAFVGKACPSSVFETLTVGSPLLVTGFTGLYLVVGVKYGDERTFLFGISGLLASVTRLLIFLALGGAALTAALWSIENVRWEEPACPRGVGHGLGALRWIEDDAPGPGASTARQLLSRPNFGATNEAAGDLKAGIVDERLQATLLTLTEEHSICVQTFKEGHRFLPNTEDGPTIPEGYGGAGGLPNTHYFGRATDIYWIDGEPVEGNGTNPAVLDVGQTLANIPPAQRPDQIIGPPDWTRRLGYGWERGWVLTQDQLDLHRDHLHIGYRDETGTNNRR